ncbi:MAG: hypothetical protein WC797_01575 [Candidatus Paceibacterota bacterium]
MKFTLYISAAILLILLILSFLPLFSICYWMGGSTDPDKPVESCVYVNFWELNKQ